MDNDDLITVTPSGLDDVRSRKNVGIFFSLNIILESTYEYWTKCPVPRVKTSDFTYMDC